MTHSLSLLLRTNANPTRVFFVGEAFAFSFRWNEVTRFFKACEPLNLLAYRFSLVRRE